MGYAMAYASAELARLKATTHHIAHCPRFGRLFVGGHCAYFAGHTLHLPAMEAVTGVLAVMAAIEFVANAGGGDA